MKYKPLPTNFTKLGWAHKQVKRIGDFAIFSKSQPHHETPSYEVFEVLKQDAYEIAGNKIEAKEAVPGNEKWGDVGFTCLTIEAANAKLEWLIKRAKNREKSKK